MKDRQKIINEYKDKVLAVESFGNNDKIYCDEFSKKDDLLHYLYELNCHEISLTEDGLNFIKDYYSLEKVALMILDGIKKGVDYKYKTKDEIIKWLKLKGEIQAD